MKVEVVHTVTTNQNVQQNQKQLEGETDVVKSSRAASGVAMETKVVPMKTSADSQ